ncbi:MAG: TAT-variant-translocated molybdopterin oxidoreductase [Planctomycetota bacterium]
MTETKPDKTKQRVSKYWRSLDELEQSSEFQEFLHREFPQAASEVPDGVSRRRWMQLMGASFTLAAVSGCRWETQKFAAFSERPEGYVPGTHTKFATSVELAGAPKHLLVTCYDGRPIKVEGNPEHPSSLGGTDSYSQALTLSLYDPDRQSVLLERDSRQTYSRTWTDFENAAQGIVGKLVETSGAGLAVLMQPTGSLSVAAGLANLFSKLPKASLYEYAPLSRGNELGGAEMAFGKPVRTHYKLAGTDVIACFDADLLGGFPETTAMARAFAKRREPNREKNAAGMNRLYCVESTFSTTGSTADHRLAVKSSDIAGMLASVRDAVAERLAGGTPQAPQGDGKADALPNYREAFAYALADDLAKSKGKGVVAVGPRQPAVAHAIAHEINAMLGNAGKTVVYSEEPAPVAKPGSLADLLGEIAAKRVDTLLILGGNPVYDAPADLDVAGQFASVTTTIHLSEYDNETSRACRWSLPEKHALEAWGDAPGWDGTVSVAQPLIEPLLGGRSAIEVLSLLADGPGADPQTLVRQAITQRLGGMTDRGWRQLLHDGFVKAEPATVTPTLTRGDFVPGPVAAQATAEDGGEALELVFTPSSHTYDGRFANNGWLQETPDFITKLTWDNAALINPVTAEKIGAKQGELLAIKTTDSRGETRELRVPAFLLPGQAEGSIALALGYGRTAAGHVGGLVSEDGDSPKTPFVVGQRGNWDWGALPIVGGLVGAVAAPVGANSYELRTSDAMYITTRVTAQPTGEPYLLATTQDHHAIDELGLEETVRRSGELIREDTLETYNDRPDFAKDVGAHVRDVELWNELTHDDNRAWGMAIDLNKCIGCTACSVACQSENNVPVVGKDQVARGREMHWIRIDRYFTGAEVRDADGEPVTEGMAGYLAGNAKIDFSNPRVAHQPVSCQHCETAPCEQVCPVAATVHSHEGLNDMVYNRCIGTRYCANNCPFKVRRFNFFHYTDRFDKANNEIMRLVMNPEVTVRSRGVMEKCTFCVQRIAKARIEAKVEGRPVRDGDVVTACQSACSTEAIAFGDLNDPTSKVAAWHKNEGAYTLRDGLRRKPRTKYLARVTNPHELLAPFVTAALPTKVNEPHDGHGGHGDGGHGHGDGDHGDHHSDTGKHAAATKRPRSRNPLGDLPIIA